MKTNKFTLSAFWVAVGVSNLLWMRGDSIAAEKLPLDKIQLPPGFEISLYAEVPGARSMTLSPSGTLFFGTQKAGKVYAIQTRGGEQNKNYCSFHGTIVGTGFDRHRKMRCCDGRSIHR